MADLLSRLKYRVGDTLQVSGPDGRGRYGKVILVKPYPVPAYFMDLYPGALECYDYIYATGPDGKVRLYAGNWLSEERLEPVEWPEGK